MPTVLLQIHQHKKSESIAYIAKKSPFIIRLQHIDIKPEKMEQSKMKKIFFLIFKKFAFYKIAIYIKQSAALNAVLCLIKIIKQEGVGL